MQITNYLSPLLSKESSKLPSPEESDQKGEKVQLIKGGILKEISMSRSDTPSLLPYQLIKKIACGDYDSFLSKLNNYFKIPFIHEKDKRQRLTSCVNTAAAVAAIFFGRQGAERKIRTLGLKGRTQLYVELPSKNKWYYSVINLFTGSVIHKIDRVDDYHGLTSEQQAVQLNSLLEPHIYRFIEFTTPSVQKMMTESIQNKETESDLQSKFRNFFWTLRYDFNSEVLDTLSLEINENKKKINQKKSFVYLVGISAHANQQTNSISYEHVFIIEQFDCEQTPHYRIYQSFFDQGTLEEELNKQTQKEGSGILNESELNAFLKKLVERYGSNSNTTIEECFGYSNDCLLATLQFQNQSLTGQSVRFVSQEIDPSDCSKHVDEIMNSSPYHNSSLSSNL